MKLPFLNRDEEQRRLRGVLAAPGGELAVVYGRRRCGKSTLIQNVLGADDIYFLADQREAPLQIQALAQEAKACGLAVIIWSYPRGHMSKAGETGLDTVAYGAHMAALLGAHIIKVKLPSEHIESEAARFAYEENVAAGALRDRVAHVVKSCFDGRRLVIFSGGEAKDEEAVFDDARAIRDGGGSGSIIGRNCFQRPRDETLALLKGMVRIYKGKDA